MGNVEIKKIVIRIGDKEASLTPEEAKSLRDALDGLLGKQEYIPYLVYPSYPVYPYWREEPYSPWTITYTDSTDGSLRGTITANNLLQ